MRFVFRCRQESAALIFALKMAFQHRHQIDNELAQREQLYSEPKDGHRSREPHAAGIGGALSDIMIAVSVISLPMIILSGLLLGLVFHNLVSQNTSGSSDLQLSQVEDNEHKAYLVSFSATRLITVASWTSSVAPQLPVFIMTLLSFPSARRILRRSQQGDTDKLPTPYQLSLFLGLLDGGLGSLWNCIKYSFWRRREKFVTPVNLSMAGLAFVTLLGFVPSNIHHTFP